MRALVSLRHEECVLRELDHPGIVKFFDATELSDHACFACEALPQTLLNYVTSTADQGADLEEAAACIMKQVLRAVEYLHGQRIVHNDIGVETIWFRSPQEVKLGGFGSCSLLPSWSALRPKNLQTNPPPVVFIADELKADYDVEPRLAAPENATHVDMWSCGIVLASLLSNGVPICEGGLDNCSTQSDRNKLTRKLAKSLLRQATDAVKVQDPALDENVE